MRPRIVAVALLSLALMAGTCEPQSATIDLDEYQPDPDWECFHLPDLTAMDPDQVAEAMARLPAEIDAERVTAGQILDLEDEAADAIDANVGFVRTNADALQVALALTDNGIDSSPIHAMGLAGHWGFAPGTPPKPVVYELEPVDDAARDAAVVAVVDSGIDDTALPGWMSGANVVYEQQDVETVAADGASHGTFVAGVIRQLAPEFAVSIARAHSISPAAFQTRPSSHDPIPFDVPSELHVAHAIERISLRGHPEIAALNLSLGAYVCDPSEDVLVMTLGRTLEDWEATHGGEVFAAAGNEDLNIPFWPAMMSIVTGIQATDGTMGVVWGAGGNPVSGPNGPWVNDQAPGVDIVGLRGGGSEEAPELVSWSGSSFASAIATGVVVRGDSIVPDYSVAGLSYLDPSSGNPVTNPRP